VWIISDISQGLVSLQDLTVRLVDRGHKLSQLKRTVSHREGSV